MAKTATQLWQERAARLRKNCQAVLKTSKKIRYVGALNEHGRTLAGVMRPGARPLFGPEDIKNEFFVASALVGMRAQITKPIGKLDHISMLHSKARIILVAKGPYLYYVSVEADAQNIPALLAKIKRAV